MEIYSLQTILDTLANKNGKKRTLYNFGPVGGWDSKIITALFFSIPFIEYAVLFNPYSFAYLGIAQAIIFFVVFASMLMLLVAGLMFALNTNLLRKISPSFEKHFDGRDLNLIVSSGVTPYSKFFENYSDLLQDDLDENEMHKALLKALTLMEDENRDLIEAMSRNR